MPLVSGARFGAFEVLERLGAGGMGEVYRARDTRLDRSVALKIIRASELQAHDRLERFKREARAISRLNHPHICALYDIG
jgi:eukaryotic-like serine/threonine-protein kinase